VPLDLDLYLSFLFATSLLLIIPGPTTLLVVAYAVSNGKRSALWTVPGVALGDATALLGSLVGLGALLATSATAFLFLKYLGAAYLIWLGLAMWRKPVSMEAPTATLAADSGPRLLVHAWLVSALNPKGIVFFMALLPQFMVPERPLIPQVLALGSSFVLLATVNATGYALLASRAGRSLRDARTTRWLQRAGGGVLIGAGMATAAMKRA
jgi:threonine/homoserine/homoserine lactone efflux protein